MCESMLFWSHMSIWTAQQQPEGIALYLGASAMFVALQWCIRCQKTPRTKLRRAVLVTDLGLELGFGECANLVAFEYLDVTYEVGGCHSISRKNRTEILYSIGMM